MTIVNNNNNNNPDPFVSPSPLGTVTPIPRSAVDSVESPALVARAPSSSLPVHQDVRVMIPLFGAAILILVLVVAFALYCRRQAERKRYENYAYSG